MADDKKKSSTKGKGDARDGGAAVDAGLAGVAGGGGVLAGSSLKNVMGRQLLYHSTPSAEAASSIREQGLLAKKTGTGAFTKHLKDVDPEIFGKSQGKTFTSPFRFISNSYMIPDRKNMSATDILTLMNPLPDNRRVSIFAPVQDMPTVRNPELKPGEGPLDFVKRIRGYRKAGKTNNYIGNEVEALLSYPALSTDVVFEGDVPTKFIRGSADYSPLSLDEMGKYIKRHPGRFAKGVAGLTAGLGAAGVGLSALKDRGVFDKEGQYHFKGAFYMPGYGEANAYNAVGADPTGAMPSGAGPMPSGAPAPSPRDFVGEAGVDFDSVGRGAAGGDPGGSRTMGQRFRDMGQAAGRGVRQGAQSIGQGASRVLRAMGPANAEELAELIGKGAITGAASFGAGLGAEKLYDRFRMGKKPPPSISAGKAGLIGVGLGAAGYGATKFMQNFGRGAKAQGQFSEATGQSEPQYTPEELYALEQYYAAQQPQMQQAYYGKTASFADLDMPWVKTPVRGLDLIHFTLDKEAARIAATAIQTGHNAIKGLQSGASHVGSKTLMRSGAKAIGKGRKTGDKALIQGGKRSRAHGVIAAEAEKTQKALGNQVSTVKSPMKSQEAFTPENIGNLSRGQGGTVWVNRTDNPVYLHEAQHARQSLNPDLPGSRGQKDSMRGMMRGEHPMFDEGAANVARKMERETNRSALNQIENSSVGTAEDRELAARHAAQRLYENQGSYDYAHQAHMMENKKPAKRMRQEVGDETMKVLLGADGGGPVAVDSPDTTGYMSGSQVPRGEQVVSEAAPGGRLPQGDGRMRPNEALDEAEQAVMREMQEAQANTRMGNQDNAAQSFDKDQTARVVDAANARNLARYNDRVIAQNAARLDPDLGVPGIAQLAREEIGRAGGNFGTRGRMAAMRDLVNRRQRLRQYMEGVEGVDPEVERMLLGRIGTGRDLPENTATSRAMSIIYENRLAEQQAKLEWARENGII